MINSHYIFQPSYPSDRGAGHGVLLKIRFRHPKPFVIKFAPVAGVSLICDLLSLLYACCSKGRYTQWQAILVVLKCISEWAPCARAGSGYGSVDK